MECSGYPICLLHCGIEDDSAAWPSQHVKVRFLLESREFRMVVGNADTLPTKKNTNSKFLKIITEDLPIIGEWDNVEIAHFSSQTGMVNALLDDGNLSLALL